MDNIDILGFTVEIHHEECPEDPWTWGDMPDIYITRFGYTTPFKETTLQSLADRCDPGEVSKMFDITLEEVEDIDGCLSGDMDDFEALLKLSNTPYYRGMSQGYSQSSWADVMIIGENAESYFDMWTTWAWGDVYWFRILKDGIPLDEIDHKGHYSLGEVYGQDQVECEAKDMIEHFLEWEASEAAERHNAACRDIETV